MTYASISPIKDPKRVSFKNVLIKLLSRKEKNLIMPIAKIIPGNAYPRVRNWLKNPKNQPLSNLFKKFITRAKIVQSIPAVNPKIIVLNKVEIRLLDRKFSEGKNIAQFISSITGKINPMKRGKKQNRKAKKFFDPSSFMDAVFLNVELE